MNGNSFVTIPQIYSTQSQNLLSPKYRWPLSIGHLDLRTETTEKSFTYNHKQQAEIQITDCGYFLEKIELEALQHFFFHYLIEVMPIIAYQELKESMIQIYDYYKDYTPSRIQTPAPLPPIKARLAEPKPSDIITFEYE